MRRVSKTNSRRHENKALRAAYFEANPDCELCNGPACEVHHIAGQLGGGAKTDTATNLLSVCRGCHNWCHENPRVGPVRCLHAKMLAGELNWEELSAISGKCLPDMLDNWIGLVAPWQWMLDELIAWKGGE